VHELGHFLVGRWCGVGVTSFSIGFGPEIAGFYDRTNTTMVSTNRNDGTM
jgi:regulator of sigma E protease